LEDQDFGFFAIIKETGVDDAGIVEFQSTYFPHPIYVNPDYSFYHALGDRRLGLYSFFNNYNPRDLICLFFDSIRRMIRKKGIVGNMNIGGTAAAAAAGGDGIVQGGIIFFGPNDNNNGSNTGTGTGRPQYAYEEETGKELPIAEIVKVFRNMQAAAAATESNIEVTKTKNDKH